MNKPRVAKPKGLNVVSLSRKLSSARLKSAPPSTGPRPHPTIGSPKSRKK